MHQKMKFVRRNSKHTARTASSSEDSTDIDSSASKQDSSVETKYIAGCLASFVIGFVVFLFYHSTGASSKGILLFYIVA